MVNEGRLMLLAIKYRQRILSRLCDLEIAENIDGKYFVSKNNKQENPWVSVNQKAFKKCNVHRSGQYMTSLKRSENLFRILLKSCKEDDRQDLDIYEDMAQNGIEVVLGIDSSVFCNFRDIHRLLKNFSMDLLWMDLPKGCRLPKSLRSYYIRVIKNQLSEMNTKKHPELLDFYYHYYKSDIKLRGIFAYAPIYKEIEWDFEFINAHINAIDWVKLIRDSNIVWTEETLLRYNCFIPYQNSSTDSIKSYLKKFDDSSIKDCYDKLGFLSSEFISSHKHLLEWNSFFSKGIFKFTPSELEFYYKYASNIETEYFSGSSCTAGSQISIKSLFKNPNFKWTSDLLLKALSIAPETVLNICVEHDEFNKLLRTLPNYRLLVDNILDYIKRDCYKVMKQQQSGHGCYPSFDYSKPIEHWNDFWLKFNNGGTIPNGAYQEFFTPENIKSNINSWNIIIEEKFTGMNRRPETNYHYYRAYNMWDRFNGNRYVKLSYELCKILHSIEIELGGSYVLEDGSYLSEDHRNEKHNALEVFSGHEIIGEDMELVLNDSVILDFIMETAQNNSIVDYIINRALTESNAEEYLCIINGILSHEQD